MSQQLSRSPKLKRQRLMPPRIPVLALRADEAAIALGVSRSILGEWTKAGIVPSIRQGGVVMYCVDGLRHWLAGKQQSLPATAILDEALSTS